MNKALVTNIQKFSLHDGEGIRTTIFFKGCGLHCLWCHNPESQNFKAELMRYEERCVECGACVKACPQNALYIDDDGKVLFQRDKCVACGRCVDFCAYNALEIAGKYYTVEELVEKVRKDIILYEESGGGVTLSGGEAMAQSIDFLLDLLKRLNRLGIKVDIDTCGFAPWESYERVLPYVDTFLYDIKTIDKKKHEEFIGEGLDLILDNLRKLNEMEAKINIRIPIIGKVNDELSEMKDVIHWLIENKIKTSQINLLPYHEIGRDKYNRLGREYDEDRMAVPDDVRMKEIKELFEKNAFNNVHIGG